MKLVLFALAIGQAVCFDFFGSTIKEAPLKPSFSVVMDEFIHQATRLPAENYQDYMVSRLSFSFLCSMLRDTTRWTRTASRWETRRKSTNARCLMALSAG